ncbi:MAG TPA: lipoyl(octanoyl) transferase LipB [Acidobacteriaceae bacterium]|nr:lipoyl(octanoyl) transferase LipB [Acidobacteriaceae bacterium]
MVLNLIHLGRIDYASALTLQQQLVEARHAGRIANTLLLLEHPPVLTLGRNSSRNNILASDDFLAHRGVEVHEINRGGDVTYHGPGQLVGYPIIDLHSFTPRLGAVDYVRHLEEALIRACGGFGVPAQRIAGRTGVWTIPGGSIPEKKIAAIGVHISRGITSHGFALNVTTDLRDFDLIVPCGISDRTVTSLELEASSASSTSDPGNPLYPPPTMQNAINAIARHFGRVFNHQILWLESLSDLNLSESSAQLTKI